MTQGYKRVNEPGGIYILAARCPYFEKETGMMKIKIGLSYKGRDGHHEACHGAQDLMP